MVKARQRDTELDLAHTELLRSTKYIDHSPRDWRTQKEFGPPRRPSVGEGSGVKGRTRLKARECFAILIQSQISGIDSVGRYPPHPQPLSRIGARGVDSNTSYRIRQERPRVTMSS